MPASQPRFSASLMLVIALALPALLPALARHEGASATFAASADSKAGQFDPPLPQTPTFTEHIAPIVFENCAACHRPGEAAPFPLLSYEDVRKRARQIAVVTESRFMPPWRAEPSDFVSFHDERRLSERQIALFRAWYEAGAPEGEAEHLPELPDFPEGWQLGEPDLVLEMTEPYDLPAEGRDIYRNFVVPIPIERTRYLRAIEFRPSTPEVVHHAIFFTDDRGEARAKDAEESEATGYRSMGGPGVVASGRVGGWAVGTQPVPMADGLAHRIEPGTDLIIQSHFNMTGRPETEQSVVGLHFADEPPTREMVQLRMGAGLDIPAGEDNYVVRNRYKLPVDAELVGIWPHAHLICREMQIIATFPDGRTEHLLHITDWDFNWQEQYRYAEPVELPAGTEIEMVFTYDNSADNPRNPHDPPRHVRFGLQSTDEMAFTWLELVADSGDDAVSILRAQIEQEGPRHIQSLLGSGDIDRDMLIRIGEQVLNDPDAPEQHRQFVRQLMQRIE